MLVYSFLVKELTLEHYINILKEKNFPINIKLLVTSNINAKGVVFAKKVGIPYLIYRNNKLSDESLKY